MPTQLFPEVLDASTLGARLSPPLYLPIGIEGQAGAGTAVIGTPYSITRPSEADTLFLAGSSLANLVKFVLAAGVNPVIAVASTKTTYGTELTERQAAWANLESDETIRIRLTDSPTQANLVALGTSCMNAELINNKQFAVVGLAAAQTKAQNITAAAAIASKRVVLVTPGIYDDLGVLKSSVYSAALVAARIAINPTIDDDLDTEQLPIATDIEKDAFSLPVYRRRVVAGVAANDFEDLLQAGVSPLMRHWDGGVAISHLRMTYIVDTTLDSLMTRLIVDQIFLDVKKYARDAQFLRRGNTAQTRESLRSGVDALLQERADWIEPKMQSDGNLGYNVQVTSSVDGRQVTVAYEGKVVRGISTIQVAADLTISV